MGWRKLYDWPFDVTQRRILRLAEVFRWVSALVGLGGSAAFLILFVMTAIGDYQLSQHGTTVLATVLDTAPYDRNGSQYLLAFTVDDRPDEQWATGIGHQRVTQTVSVVVDRQDHTHIALPESGARRGVGYGIQIFAAVFFALVGLTRMRMDAAGYRRYAWERYGRRPPLIGGH